MIPGNLKSALKARTRLYAPVVDLLDEPHDVEGLAADPVEVFRPNKRPPAPVSRSRADASSTSLAVVPLAGVVPGTADPDGPL